MQKWQYIVSSHLYTQVLSNLEIVEDSSYYHQSFDLYCHQFYIKILINYKVLFNIKNCNAANYQFDQFFCQCTYRVALS